MNKHKPLVPDEPRGPGDSAPERDDVRAQRRRMIRTVLIGVPAVLATSARGAQAQTTQYGEYS